MFINIPEFFGWDYFSGLIFNLKKKKRQMHKEMWICSLLVPFRI